MGNHSELELMKRSISVLKEHHEMFVELSMEIARSTIIAEIEEMIAHYTLAREVCQEEAKKADTDYYNGRADSYYQFVDDLQKRIKEFRDIPDMILDTPRQRRKKNAK